MLSVLFLCLCSFVVLAYAQKDDAIVSDIKACVEFQIADNFGSGWGSAYLQIQVDHGGDKLTSEIYAPDADHNPLSVKYCNSAADLEISSSRRRLFSKEVAPAKTLSVSVQGKTDAFIGAVLWKTIDLQTNEILMCNSDTVLSMELNVQDSHAFIILNKAENLVTQSSSCKSCIQATEFNKLSSEVGTTKTSFSVSSIRSLSSSSSTSSVSSRRLLSNIYLDGKDNSWYNADGYGTTYEILDVTGTNRYYTGQLCGADSSDSCEVALPTGQYLWRVNGGLDPNKDSVAWQYCGAHGGATTELEFSVDAEGNCVPEAWRSASMSDTSTLTFGYGSKSAYIFQGSFLLTRLSDTHPITDSSLQLLTSTIAMESIGNQQATVMMDDGVSIVSYEDANTVATGTETAAIADAEKENTVTVTDGSSSSLMSSDGTTSVTSTTTTTTTTDVKQFTFNLELSKSEFDTLRGDSSVNEVVAMLRQNLRASMESGNFVTDIVQKAAYESEDSLQTVVSAELLRLSLLQTSNEAEELLEVVDEGFSILADGIVLSGCVFGLLMGLWTFRYIRKRAEQREFEIDLSRSSVSTSTSLPRSLHGHETIHQSLRPSAVPDVEQIQ